MKTKKKCVALAASYYATSTTTLCHYDDFFILLSDVCGRIFPYSSLETDCHSIYMYGFEWTGW